MATDHPSFMVARHEDDENVLVVHCDPDEWNDVEDWLRLYHEANLYDLKFLPINEEIINIATRRLQNVFEGAVLDYRLYKDIHGKWRLWI